MAMLLVLGCGGAQTAAPQATQPRCGEVVGEWSSVVDGLRGRIVTSGSREDRSSLSVAIELENVSTEPRAIHWDGRPTLGFATFQLEDETGTEVPDPPWALGGNEAVGSLREVIAASSTVRHVLGDVLDEVDGGRILRIGAFWSREMPADGSRRQLRALITGRAPLPDDLPVTVGDHEEGMAVSDSREAPQGRAWTGPLELPPVCID